MTTISNDEIWTSQSSCTIALSNTTGNLIVFLDFQGDPYACFLMSLMFWDNIVVWIFDFYSLFLLEFQWNSYLYIHMSLMVRDEFLSELLKLLILELSCHFTVIYWKAVTVIWSKKKCLIPVQLEYIQSLHFRIYSFNELQKRYTLRICLLSC